MLGVLVAAFTVWPFSLFSLLIVWVLTTFFTPGIVAILMFFKFNSKPDDPKIWPKPYPSLFHILILTGSRVVFRRNLPRSISQPLNALAVSICHMLFETRKLPLALAEKCVFSQFGEDGVTEALFARIGHGGKFYVEFGTEDATECNTRYMREKLGWKGLLMDGGYEDASIGLQKEYIYPDNVEALFDKYNVPEEFDYLVIDIDSNDFWVWKAITKYKPRVVCMEVNSCFGLEDKVVKYDRDMVWNFSNYHSGSITAYVKLAKEKGYSLIHCTMEGLNLFFVRDDLLDQLGDLVPKDLINDPAEIYMRLVGPGPHGGHRPDPRGRDFVTSEYVPPELKDLYK
jgi:hypothetical protein